MKYIIKEKEISSVQKHGRFQGHVYFYLFRCASHSLSDED